MKKILLIILVLSALLLVGCGPKEITSEELTTLLETEFNGELIELNIVSQILNENSLEIEAFFSIDVDGIGQEGLTNIKCLYNEDDKNWQLHYANVDFNGWKYYPMVPSMEIVSFDDQIIRMFNGFGKSVLISDGAYKYTGNEEKYKFANVKSIEFNKAMGTDKITFDLVYEDDNFTGTTECTMLMKFEYEEWSFDSVSYDPINVEWKEENSITPAMQDVVDKYSGSWFKPYMIIEDEHLYLNTDTLTSYTLTSTTDIESLDTVKVEGNIVMEQNVATISSDIEAIYKYQNGKWNFISFEFINVPTVVFIHDLLEESKWEGYYFITKKNLATIEINSYLDAADKFEGTLSFGPSESTDILPGSFHVTLEYVLDEDYISVKAGDWIDQPDGYNTIDMRLTFVDDNLVGKVYSNNWRRLSGDTELIKVEN